MNSYRSILGVLILVVLGFGIWLFFKLRSNSTPAQRAGVITASAPARSLESGLTPPKARVIEEQAKLKSEASTREQMFMALKAINHKEITFYGKVVDQFGLPISGVDVTGAVISGLGPDVDERHTITDTAGVFSFIGMRGRTFDYHLDKKGYKTMPEGEAFDYTELVPPEKRHHPDPNNPVVLKMWKLQGAEPMTHFEGRDFKMIPDGTPIRIDLKTGKKVEVGGDIIVSLWHAEAEAEQRLRRYPWKAEFVVPNGGLVENVMRWAFEAPENGYQSTVILAQTGQEPKYQSGMEKEFYVKTGGGEYAHITIGIRTDTSPRYDSYLGLSCWLNPKAGSRNLEFDPAMEVKP